jgi:hypothetical protein
MLLTHQTDFQNLMSIHFSDIWKERLLKTGFSATMPTKEHSFYQEALSQDLDNMLLIIWEKTKEHGKI